ncbi:MAG: magnesium transporter MgtC [Bacteroidetes bacterium]|nr:magnesium transporter MgtC [Bacteroidota bacterium]
MDVIPLEIRQLLLAMLLGGFIGAEREYRNKSAGFRTVTLITVGSAIITILSYKIGVTENRDRIAANIVQGIGFLGAGAIFKDDNRVNGLTTAATIWAAAAIGMGIGAGEYWLAIGGTILILFVLYAVVGLEKILDRANRIRKYKLVSLYKHETLLHYEQMFESYGLQHVRGRQSRVGNEMIGNWVVSGAESKHEKLIQELLTDPELKEFDF